MTVSEFVARARRASRHSPQHLITRLVEMAAHRLRRPWSNVLPHLVTARWVVSAAGADSLDALWERQQRAPFPLSPRRHDLFELLAPLLGRWCPTDVSLMGPD
jgi:hypothetical protein